MPVDILAIGSRGDVQPYVALGLGLRSAGFQVRVVTLAGFEEFVRSRGLEHLSIGESPLEIAQTAEGRDWVQKRGSVTGFLRGFARLAGPLIENGIGRYWRECANLEAVISSPLGMLVGSHIAERARVPLVQAQLAPPVTRSRYDLDGNSNFGAQLESRIATWADAAFHLVIWAKLRRFTNQARGSVLELPPLPLLNPLSSESGKPVAVLGGYSPAVAAVKPDWPAWIHITGYWFLDDANQWTPPAELVAFLEAGDRPVFIGFGSTPFPNPADTTSLVVRAVSRAGRRAILIAGGSGLGTGQLSDSVLSLESAPHDWLFPRVSAAVHHGGAGVTGAALRAGLPSVVVPVFADQPFWGSRVFKLGAGPQPIPARKLTEDNLTSGLEATQSPRMQERAAAIGSAIRSEDGIARAVEVLHKILGDRASLRMRQHHAG